MITQKDVYFKVRDRILPEIMHLMAEKGEEYAPEDAFENFKEGAGTADTKAAFYLMGLGTKHWVSLCRIGKLTKLGGKHAEVKSKAIDIIIYMLLLIIWNEEVAAGREYNT